MLGLIVEVLSSLSIETHIGTFMKYSLSWLCKIDTCQFASSIVWKSRSVVAFPINQGILVALLASEIVSVSD